MGFARLSAAFVLLLAVSVALPNLGVAAEKSQSGAMAIALPEPLTKPEVRELISRLSDDQVRALLIRQLDKAATEEAEAGAGARLASRFDQRLQDLQHRLGLMWSSMPKVPLVGAFVIERLTAERSPSYLWRVLLYMAVIFLGAAVVEWLFRHLFKSFSQLVRGERRESTFDRINVAGLRMLTELLATGVFAVAAIVIFFALFDDHEPTRAAIATVFWAVILVRVLAALVGPLFSPRDPDSRLLPLEDKTAQRGFRRAIAVGVMIVVAWQLDSLLRQYELPEGPMLAMGATLTLAVLGAIITMIWHDRRAVALMILPEDRQEGAASPAREFLAANWHVLASCYILGLWLLGMVGRILTEEGQGAAIIVSLCLLPAVPMIDWLARVGIRRLCEGSQRRPGEDAPLSETEAAGDITDRSQDLIEQEASARTPRGITGQAFEPVLIRNMRVILGLLVVVLLSQVWGLDLHNVAAASMSERVADALFEIIITLILASAVWGFIKTAIAYYAPQEAIGVEQMVEGDAGGTGLSRAQTLLPLFRKFILITLIVIVSLVILSSLGVSIGPLIAGAGVVGLAIGFGAQTLVRDIISGAFFLADDAFRVGEYIDVGVAMGMVEKISVRSFRLRHHNGPINTIPFSEVQRVKNFSRDWVLMKLEMRVPSDTDLEKLRKVVKKVGQAMMDDPEFGPSLLQPVKSQGVNRMDDDGAFVIRVKFMCKPGEQFVLRREVFRRVQEAFAQNGIRFASKRVMVEAQSELTQSQAVAAALAVEKPGKG